MKTLLTAETRPRMASGVSICTSVWRTTTLTLSKAPTRNIAASESQRLRDRPKTIVAAPKPATAQSIVRPARADGRQVGQQHGHGDGPGRLGRPQVADRRRVGTQDVLGNTGSR